MPKRFFVGKGIIILISIVVTIVALMWIAGKYSPLILSAMAVMIILGVLAGGLMPSILVTSLIIGLTTFGSGILLLGYVVISTPVKILLLLAFPLTATITAVGRYILGEFSWINYNLSAIENYYAHYNQVVKLQTKYNAQKYFHKENHFINKLPGIWQDVTAVHWEHHHQIEEFDKLLYQQKLREIAKVLKNYRLPSEAIYYIGNATFLIFSHRLTMEDYQRMNDLTKEKLAAIRVNNVRLQYKWGEERVTKENLSKYQDLDDVLRHINRDMETDLVVEYLKGGK